MQINWKKILERVLDPCKQDRETWEKERLKRAIEQTYGVNMMRAAEARKRNRVIV